MGNQALSIRGHKPRSNANLRRIDAGSYHELKQFAAVRIISTFAIIRNLPEGFTVFYYV